MLQLLLLHNKPQTYQCKITTILGAQKFCQDPGTTPLLLTALRRSLTDTQLMDRLGWKTWDGFSHRLVQWQEWLGSWSCLVTRVRLCGLSSMAISGQVDFPDGNCLPSERMFQEKQAEADWFWWLTLRIHVMLLSPHAVGQSSPAPAQIQGAGKDSTSWWGSDWVTGEHVGREMFFENKIWIWKIQSAIVYQLY